MKQRYERASAALKERILLAVALCRDPAAEPFLIHEICRAPLPIAQSGLEAMELLMVYPHQMEALRAAVEASNRSDLKTCMSEIFGA